jgi:glycosyltransferase involved in cell wall biosynthesis
MKAIFKDYSRSLIVITTQTSWQEVPRMRHYVAQQLSKVFNVLFIELDSKGLSKITVISDSICILKLGYYVPGIWRFPLAKSKFNQFQAYLIESKVREIQADKKIILNFKFDFYEVYQRPVWSTLYYFMNDDFVNMPPDASLYEKEKKRIAQNKTIDFCSRIFVSSGALAADVENKAKLVTVILSGHDFNTSLDVKLNSNSLPVVCFMGFIHDTLEVEWIENLAATNKFNICLIGPVESEAVKSKLSIYGNVRIDKPLVGSELQTYLSKADVFIMPYKVVEINTKASVPAKLFQYLACGRPVISGPMPNLIEMPPYFVYQAYTKEEFLQNVNIAIREDDALKARKRIDYAKNNTWDTRGELMTKVILEDLV